MFQARQILIVKDEFLIARELAETVVALDGTIIGPVASIHGALEILDREAIAGAILSATGLPAAVAARWPRLAKPAAA